jgi:hypothetical protein
VEGRTELAHLDPAGGRPAPRDRLDRHDHGIKAVHVFRFQATDGGTLARSEESWEGLLASLLKGYSRRTLDKGIGSVLSHLKTEAERRAATA